MTKVAMTIRPDDGITWVFRPQKKQDVVIKIEDRNTGEVLAASKITEPVKIDFSHKIRK